MLTVQISRVEHEYTGGGVPFNTKARSGNNLDLEDRGQGFRMHCAWEVISEFC